MVEGRLVEQAGGFLLAGALCAVVDFGVFNLPAGPRRWRRVPANVVSTALAMTAGYLLNHCVFTHGKSLGGTETWRFLIITLSAALVLQNAVLAAASGFLDSRCNWPDWFQRNLAKALAVGTGMVWNFTWYRAWVFG